MKYGIRNRSLAVDWEEAVSSAADIGYDGLEIIVGSEEELEQLFGNRGEALKDRAREAGIEICSLSVGCFRAHNFAIPDVDMDESVAFVERSLSACSLMGGDVILLPHFEPENIDLDPRGEEAYIRGLSRCTSAASRNSVFLGLETSFSWRQLRRILDAVDSEMAGVYQDLANAIFYGHDPFAMLDHLGEEIVMIHIKELEGDLLGEGEMEWGRCFEAIDGISYDGWLVMETKPTDDPIRAAEENLKFTRAGVEEARHSGG